MTTVHAQVVGNKTLVPREEFDRLVELAQRSEPIVLQVEEDDVPTLGVSRLAEQGGGFDFWSEEGEDLYSLEDGEPV
jgi:hypothetical protein